MWRAAGPGLTLAPAGAVGTVPAGGGGLVLAPVGSTPVLAGVNLAGKFLNLDPTRKIARQVGWLNRNTPLKVKISYSDIVEPLSRLEVSDAMKILKDIEAIADQVDNPTGYVVAAAARAGAGGGLLLAPSDHGTMAGAGLGGVFVNELGGLSHSPASGAGNFIVHHQNIGGLGGLQPANAGLILDSTGKIARQVGWLNRNANLQEPISFTDVVEPLSWLEVSAAMSILKEVEQHAATIQHPTQYVLQAATRTGLPLAAGVTQGPVLMQTVQVPVQQMQHQVVHIPMHQHQAMQQLQMVQPQPLLLDPTGKIARQVGWLNKNAGLKEPLSFSDVVEPLSQLDVTQAMQILKDLEGQAEHVKNPTGYVAAAAARAGAVSTGQVAAMLQPLQAMQSYQTVQAPQHYQYMDVQQVSGGLQQANAGMLDPTGKIGRQVGWLNKNANMTEPIQFNDIVEALSMLEISVAMKILKELETEGSQVPNPTAHVLSKAAAAGAVGTGDLSSIPVAPDPTGKIARQVGWLNKNAKLVEPISFSDVVQPLSMIDVTSAMKVLKDVEDQAASIANPTQYVITAAQKQSGITTGINAGPAVTMARAAPMMTQQIVYTQAAQGLLTAPGPKRTWHEEPTKPSEFDEEGKQIARHVGRINGTVCMVEKLSYSDVKPHLEACGLEAATKILKDLEASAGSVKSPTSYVIAAARRACSGEGIPAKRARFG